MIKHKIDLFLLAKGLPQAIDLVQADTGREIECSFPDFKIPVGATAQIWAIKPSGKIVYNNAEILNNTVVVKITNQMIAESGTTVAQIKIKSAAESVSSFTFYMRCQTDVSGNGVESKDEITVLDKFLMEQEKRLTDFMATKTAQIQKNTQDVTTLKEDLTKLENEKADAIISKKTGKTIVIDDASNLAVKSITGNGEITITGKNILNIEKNHTFIPFEAKANTLFTLITNGVESAGGNVKFIDIDNKDIWFSIDKGQTKTTRQINKDIKGFYNFLEKSNGLKYCLTVGENDKFEEYSEQVVTAPVSQEQLKTIHTNYPTTVITSENEVTVEYVADTRLYVEKENQVLKTQILDIQQALVNAKIAGGGIIQIKDSAKLPIKNLRLFGKSEQAVTKGYQLIDNMLSSQVLNGVSFIVNKDKSVTINGTASGRIEVDIWNNKNGGSLVLKTGVQYYNKSGTTLYIRSGEAGYSLIVDGSSYTPKTDETLLQIYIRVEDRETINKTIYPMLTTNTNATYEPFTNGKPAPSPEYPMPITIIGEKGNINVSVDEQKLILLTPKGLASVNSVHDEITLTERIQRIGQIASYNNEPITTDFMSSTGQLTVGAQVNYVLPNPVRTPLTPTEQEAFRKLYMNYPTTTISNDENADMELEYTVDTKSYVDTKIAEISGAVIAQKGI